MSSAHASSQRAGETASTGTVDLKLEVVTIPVSDVDRAKEFYGETLGWRLDADFANGDRRVVQFTPPGSGARSTSASAARRPRPDPPRACS